MKAWPRISSCSARARETTHPPPSIPPGRHIFSPSLPARENFWRSVPLPSGDTFPSLLAARGAPLRQIKADEAGLAAVLCAPFLDQSCCSTAKTTENHRGDRGKKPVACGWHVHYGQRRRQSSSGPPAGFASQEQGFRRYGTLYRFFRVHPSLLFWPHPPLSVINFGPPQQEWIAHHTPTLPPTSSAVLNLHACT